MKINARLEDVARVAGVSTATVSRALTQPHRVRPATREIVNAVVQRLGYVPDASARALALGRTQTIGCVIPTLDHAIFARSTHALQTTLNTAGYQLLVASHNYDLESEFDLVQSLQQRGVDGLVLVGTDHHKNLWTNLKQWKKPCVLTWSCDPRLPSVGFDNAAIAQLATEHLLQLGHRQIAMVSGITRYNDRARQRVEGFRATLLKHQLSVPNDWIVQEPLTIAGGRAGLSSVLRSASIQGCMRPTAVICGNDLLATGVLLEAQRIGLRVPEDLSICGIDNHELSGEISPALSTINLPTSDLGRIAAAQMLAALAGTPIAQLSLLPFTLLSRESTSPPALQKPSKAELAKKPKSMR